MNSYTYLHSIPKILYLNTHLCMCGHITQGMVFLCVIPRPVTCILKTMQTPWQNSDSTDAGCISNKNTINPCKNEDSRWSPLPETGPSPDCSRCRCARRRVPRGGNTHFHCNALVAPFGRFRRPTWCHKNK